MRWKYAGVVACAPFSPIFTNGMKVKTPGNTPIAAIVGVVPSIIGVFESAPAAIRTRIVSVSFSAAASKYGVAPSEVFRQLVVAQVAIRIGLAFGEPRVHVSLVGDEAP